MHAFRRDEPGYRAWLQAHPDGYVVNSYATPSPDYLVLHSARCWTIRRNGVNYTSGDYAKTCSESLEELRRWAQELGGELHPCGHCRPVA